MLYGFIYWILYFKSELIFIEKSRILESNTNVQLSFLVETNFRTGNKVGNLVLFR